MTGKIRKTEVRPDILQFDTIRIDALVRARAGALQGDREVRIAVGPGRITQLNVSEEHHSIGSPVFDGIRKDIGVHEHAPGLAGADLAILAPGVPQPECGLTGVHSRAEKFEFEDRSDLPVTGREESFYTETGLPHSGKPIPVSSEFIRKRR
jgi:hypothetical protein